MSRSVDVAIVGGGPAGATLATLLARAGHDIALLERAPAWRWRPGGVFASPAVREALSRTGLPSATLDRVTRSIPAMRLESARGWHVRLTYGADDPARPSAVGLDRSELDPALLALAREAGAAVHSGASVTSVELDGDPVLTFRQEAGTARLRARFVVGADGIRSTVARLAGVARPGRMGDRVGLTFHAADPRAASERPDARMIVLEGAYCGLAPVPGGRLNIGIVLAARRWRAALADEGASAIVGRILGSLPMAADDRVAWADAQRCDAIAGAAPIGHRVARRAGERWLLVGSLPASSIPSLGRGCIARSSPLSWRPRPSTHGSEGASGHSMATSTPCADVSPRRTS